MSPTPNLCPLCDGPAYATRTVNGTQEFKVGCPSCGIELKAAWYRGEEAPTKDILSLWNNRPTCFPLRDAVRTMLAARDAFIDNTGDRTNERHDALRQVYEQSLEHLARSAAGAE